MTIQPKTPKKQRTHLIEEEISCGNGVSGAPELAGDFGYGLEPAHSEVYTRKAVDDGGDRGTEPTLATS
jgi:hypothetical protein